MDHLDRDDLILLHYGEKASPGAREHLLGCEECRRESALLRRVLDAVDDAAAETPELAPAWEEQLWNRLRWKLERPRSRWIGWAAAAAATIAIAFLAGRTFMPRSTPIAPQRQPRPPRDASASCSSYLAITSAVPSASSPR